jgi:hypothetical protein
MTHSEHNAKTPSAATGFFARLRVFLRAPGTGAPARALLALPALLLAALAGGLVFLGAPALALNPERTYEMVTPLYKAGYGASNAAVALDGNSVWFNSLGAFAGIPLPARGSSSYVARRVEGSGWSTVPIEPPFVEGSSVFDVSSSLEEAISETKVGEAGSEQSQLLVHRIASPDVPAAWLPSGPVIRKVVAEPGIIGARRVATSGNLCHIAIEGSRFLLEAPPASSELYDLSRGCAGESPSLRLVAVRNSDGVHGEPEVLNRNCTPEAVSGGTGIRRHAVSEDGEIFFTDCSGGAGRQLFVRLGGARTVEVSRPLLAGAPFGGCGDGGKAGEVPGQVPCPGASERPGAGFAGASADGSRVYFTTGAGLVSGDSDLSSNLFMATIGCPAGGPGSCEEAEKQVTSLVRVSEPQAPAQAAEVFGVLSISKDGGGAYFMADGVLSAAANAEGEVPLKGADNLYAYDAASRALRFVGDLCSAAGRSGEAADPHCPTSLDSTRNDSALWGQSGEAQTTAEGRYLVFSTYAQLVRTPPRADTDAARDVYRFDMATGALDRVSVGEGGYDTNGNNSAFDATITTVGTAGGSVVEDEDMSTRAISNDGSRIVFSGAEPLSPHAAPNGHLKIYEWHEGSVSLISSGTSTTDDILPVITPSGRDIFFTTSQGLVPQDTEGDHDVYDARLGGGFPPAPVERAPCGGEGCQGPLTNPAPLLVPGSVSQAPGENLAPPVSKPVVKTKKTTIKCSRGKKPSHGKCVKAKTRKKSNARKAGYDRRARS